MFLKQNILGKGAEENMVFKKSHRLQAADFVLRLRNHGSILPLPPIFLWYNATG
jgi:hypothetical protein